jgi:anti-sigma regulatory factor (Ser/Thr protein kinase)
MSASATLTETRDARSFSHEAFLYDSPEAFLDGSLAFIRGGLEAQEPMLVAVSAAKIGMLRSELGRDADDVQFADMQEIGINPARIIPAWRAFVSERSSEGRGLRGIGEPIWAERSADELVECQRHESLLNLAFADTPSFRLLCPYDSTALDAAVIEEAQRSHPVVVEDGVERHSATCRSTEMVAAPFDAPLPEPAPPVRELAFAGAGALEPMRRLVSRWASEARLSGEQEKDLVLAVNEVATNTIRHAGGDGRLRLWVQHDVAICEVRDGGRIAHPMVGREQPPPGTPGGWGLWLANQLCDLVQIRAFPGHSVVRLHMRRA